MKKFFVILLLSISAVPAFSQVDTLRWRQREPTYYYWGTHWADYYNGSTYMAVEYASVTIARRCYTDSILKVIGIAAPASIFIPHETVVDTFLTNRIPEYFQLYEATADSFYLMAEARYDTNNPRYCIAMHDPWWSNPHLSPEDTYYGHLDSVPYVYEVYFDKPYIVSDSFYVATTNYNSDRVFNSTTRRYEPGNRYCSLYYYTTGDYTASDFFKLRYTNPYDSIPENQLTDRDLTFRDLYLQGWIYADPLDDDCLWYPQFRYIFPIFDTTGLDIHGFQWVGECDTVRNVQMIDANGNQGWAYLSWNARQYGRWWEVSYGPVGTTPENGLRDTVQSSFIRLEGLQADSDYVVYVRERCREDTRGAWSRPYTLMMPNASEVEAPKKSDVDIHTHLIPNPASGPVTVISGFRIEAVEVYTVAGTLVETIGLKANSGVIDTSRWPKGAYILRIRTSHGDTAKRLVVQ